MKKNQQNYIFDNSEVNISLPDCQLSDVDNIKYFFEKYLFSLERGKPDQRAANQLKLLIDIIQLKVLTINISPNYTQ